MSHAALRGSLGERLRGGSLGGREQQASQLQPRLAWDEKSLVYVGAWAF